MLERGWIVALTVLVVMSASTQAQAAPLRLAPDLLLSIDAMPLAQVEASPREVSEPPPSTGTGLIVVGWIALGLGALNLASLPICYADFYPRESEDLCVGLSLVVAGVGVSLAIPFLIVGYVNRSDYNDWKQRNAVARHLLNTQLALLEGGAMVSYRGEL